MTQKYRITWRAPESEESTCEMKVDGSSAEDAIRHVKMIRSDAVIISVVVDEQLNESNDDLLLG